MVSVRVYSKLRKCWKYFVGVFNKTIIPLAGWIWDDYSQLGATRLVGYVPSHVQRTLVE